MEGLVRQCQCYLKELCRYCKNIPRDGDRYCWRHRDGQCSVRTPQRYPKATECLPKKQLEKEEILSPRQLKRVRSRTPSSVLFGQDIDKITPVDLFWLIIGNGGKLPTSSNVIALLNDALSNMSDDVKAKFAKKFLQGGKIVEQNILKAIQDNKLPVDELAKAYIQDVLVAGRSQYDKLLLDPKTSLPTSGEWARLNAELISNPEQLAINQDPDQSISVDEIYKQIIPPGFLHSSVRRAVSLVK